MSRTTGPANGWLGVYELGPLSDEKVCQRKMRGTRAKAREKAQIRAAKRNAAEYGSIERPSLALLPGLGPSSFGRVHDPILSI